jgi:biopolymer transport protein ExbB/TolQ/biopolymer transport protein ExbD
MNVFTEILRSFSLQSDSFVFMWVLAGIAVFGLFLIVERLLTLRARRDVDAPAFTEHIRGLISQQKLEEAFTVCAGAGPRALPRIAGAGIKMARRTPHMIRTAMEEETVHMVSQLEKRSDLIMMCGNISTLVGLMGTIYGLIICFAAVAQPDVAATEKTSLLASGISTAMNTTLLGLFISVPCVFFFSLIRGKTDNTVAEIDRYATSLIKDLNREETLQKGYKLSGKRMKQEVDTEPNIAPMMNLMVVLIPLLLSSAEFVKLGAIDLKLPEKGGGGGGGSATSQEKKEAKLNLGVIITDKGFTLAHYFMQPDSGDTATRPQGGADVDIPLTESGTHDYSALNKRLASIKRNTLFELLSSVYPDAIPPDATLLQLYNAYTKRDLSQVTMFADHEAIKLVAEEDIDYKIVVNVMDAARGISFPNGNVTMFPEVSLGGGIKSE